MYTFSELQSTGHSIYFAGRVQNGYHRQQRAMVLSERAHLQSKHRQWKKSKENYDPKAAQNRSTKLTRLSLRKAPFAFRQNPPHLYISPRFMYYCPDM